MFRLEDGLKPSYKTLLDFGLMDWFELGLQLSFRHSDYSLLSDFGPSER